MWHYVSFSQHSEGKYRIHFQWVMDPNKIQLKEAKAILTIGPSILLYMFIEEPTNASD
jgi:hypothetical protein